MSYPARLLLPLLLAGCGAGGDRLVVTLTGEIDGEPVDGTYVFVGSTSNGSDVGQVTTGSSSDGYAYAWFTLPRDDTPWGPRPQAVLGLIGNIQDPDAEVPALAVEPTDGDPHRRGGLGLAVGFIDIEGFYLSPVLDLDRFHATGNLQRPLHVAGSTLADPSATAGEALLTAEISFSYRSACNSDLDAGDYLHCGDNSVQLEVQQPGPLPIATLDPVPACPSELQERYFAGGVGESLVIEGRSMQVVGADAALTCRTGDDRLQCAADEVIAIDGCKWTVSVLGGYNVQSRYWMRLSARADDRCEASPSYCKLHAYSVQNDF